MDSISDFVRGGRAGCGVQVSGISPSVAFSDCIYPKLVKFCSDILIVRYLRGVAYRYRLIVPCYSCSG